MTDLRQAAQQALEALNLPSMKTQQMLIQKDEAITVLREALAQPEQEPVAWILTDENINSIQVASVQRLIDRLKHAHHTDLCVRINGQDEWFQADWLKHMVRATPPAAQPEQELVAPKCGAIIEVFGKDWRLEYLSLPVGKHKLYTQQYTYTTPSAAQRPWQGLTEEEASNIWDDTVIATVIPFFMGFTRAIEAKLKERNNG